MKTRGILMLVGMFYLCSTHAQSDTIIYAVGKIFNHQTKEPVTASIAFQSLPYGNRVGMLQGDSFSIPLYDNEKYSITVEAPGFAPAKYMLDPSAANAERKVVQDIELALPDAAGKVAETTHHVGKVMRLDALIFDQQSAVIGPESYPELNSVVEMLHNNPDMIIQLEGHTDFRGDAKMNLKLSEQRVYAVRDYVIKKGVSKNRVKAKAFGGTMPLSRENTEVAHKMNRRVEVRVLDN